MWASLEDQVGLGCQRPWALCGDHSPAGLNVASARGDAGGKAGVQQVLKDDVVGLRNSVCGNLF